MLGRAYENPVENGYGHNPYASLSVGAGALRAAPNGLFLVRFAWADPTAGIASNVYAAGLILGFALQTFNWWNRLRVQRVCGAPLLSPGLPCVLALAGDFATRFPFGAQAGSQVYANPVTGQAACQSSGPAPILDSNGQVVLDSYGFPVWAEGVPYLPTPWTALGNSSCGGAARISSSVAPVFNLAA